MRFMSYAAVAALAAVFTVNTAQLPPISQGPARPSPIRSTPNGPMPTRKRPASGSTISRSARAAASSRSRPRRSRSAPPTSRSAATISTDSGLVQFPMVMGGIVPVINRRRHQAWRARARRPDARQDLPGRRSPSGTMRRSRSSIRRPSCPRRAIAVVHRSDGSGTTFNFTNYLSKVSPDWKDKVGTETAVEWPVGIGAKGNEGVANNVAQTKGSIGYVEYAYAKQNKMTYTKHGQQGRQDGRPRTHSVPGRRRQRRLEVRSGLRRDPDRSGRRRAPGR